MTSSTTLSSWTNTEVESLFNMPFMELIYQAAKVHRKFFDPNEIQLSSLLSIKTGGCSENCAYCSQSAHYHTETIKQKMLSFETIIHQAKLAKASGATRFCMSAAWREPKANDLNKICIMISEIKNMGLETCVTLGLLADGMAEELKKKQA